MNETELAYEAPMIAEAGYFAEETRITCCGRWFDGIIGYYFDI
ncbi:lasso RiPP family leader peptide-containing protein [Streptomyces sp. NPDC059455]